MSCGHSFCRPCLGGAVPSRCPLCQERLKLLGVGAARCSVVLCGLLEKCVEPESRLAWLAARLRDCVGRGDAQEALRMAQRGLQRGKHRRARRLSGCVGLCGCGVPGAGRAAEMRVCRRRRCSRRVLAWGTSPQHPGALPDPERADLGSWKCWKGRAGGGGEWGPSCWAFIPGGWASPTARPSCQGLAGQGARPVSHRPRASGQRGASSQQLLAPCHPAIFQGQRKSSAGGACWSLYKVVGIFQSGTDTSLPPEPGKDTALAELLPQPHDTGQSVVSVCVCVHSPFCNQL